MSHHVCCLSKYATLAVHTYSLVSVRFRQFQYVSYEYMSISRQPHIYYDTAILYLYACAASHSKNIIAIN